MAEYETIQWPSWITDHKRWNQAILANTILPGNVILKEGAGVKIRVENNKESGSDGGGSLIKGMETPKFSFELFLRTKKDEEDWYRILPILQQAQDPSKRTYLPVYHPLLAQFRIVACIIDEIHTSFPMGGTMVAKIHCMAVSPVKAKATKKINPKGVGGNANGPAAISIGGPGSGPQRFPGVTPPSQKAPVR